MKNKIVSVYHYEKKGLALSFILMSALALLNGYLSAPPEWLPANNVWLIGLLCVAAAVVTFATVMYKRVTILKRGLKNYN